MMTIAELERLLEQAYDFGWVSGTGGQSPTLDNERYCKELTQRIQAVHYVLMKALGEKEI